MRNILLCSLLGLLATAMRGQTLGPTLLAAGSAHAELFSFGTLDWSVGETVVSTFDPSGGSDILTQGFHQVFVTVTSGTNNEPADKLHLLVYPNPTSQWLTVECDRPIRVRLFNMLGAQIQQHSAFIQNPTLDVHDLATGMYFLEVLGAGDQMPHIFKIEIVQP